MMRVSIVVRYYLFILCLLFPFSSYLHYYYYSHFHVFTSNVVFFLSFWCEHICQVDEECGLSKYWRLRKMNATIIAYVSVSLAFAPADLNKTALLLIYSTSCRRPQDLFALPISTRRVMFAIECAIYIAVVFRALITCFLTTVS